MTRAIVPSMSSAPAWRRLRASLTAALFVVATTGGVALAVQAPAVSPVAPPVTVAAAPAPGTVDAPPAATDGLPDGNPTNPRNPGNPGDYGGFGGNRGAGAHGGGPR
jgi:hypothetical protein